MIASGKLDKAVTAEGHSGDPGRPRCDRSSRGQDRGLNGYRFLASSDAAADIGQLKELRQRLFFVIGAIVVFRIGSFIPLPGIDPHVLAALVEQQRGTILEMFNMFSGGCAEAAVDVRARGSCPTSRPPSS